jgi:rod shape-determining protein MreC
MWGKTPVIRTLTALLLFLVLEVISISFIANESIYQRAKVTGVTMQIKSAISGFSSGLRQYFGLRSLNELLRLENLRLLKENESYKALAGMADTMPGGQPVSPDFSYIPARIVANSTNRLHNYIILNKGSDQGVRKDMGVVSPGGIVGIITSVSRNYSYVISFLNINQSVSAKIGTSGAFGPMIWEGRRTGYATLKEIPFHIEYMVGDTVYTSGFSSIYPPDIPLGTVRKSSVRKGSYHEIQVKLFQDFSTLYYVNIVANTKKDELDFIIRENNGKTQ